MIVSLVIGIVLYLVVYGCQLVLQFQNVIVCVQVFWFSGMFELFFFIFSVLCIMVIGVIGIFFGLVVQMQLMMFQFVLMGDFFLVSCVVLYRIIIRQLVWGDFMFLNQCISIGSLLWLCVLQVLCSWWWLVLVIGIVRQCVLVQFLYICSLQNGVQLFSIFSGVCVLRCVWNCLVLQFWMVLVCGMCGNRWGWVNLVRMMDMMCLVEKLCLGQCDVFFYSVICLCSLCVCWCDILIWLLLLSIRLQLLLMLGFIVWMCFRLISVV